MELCAPQLPCRGRREVEITLDDAEGAHDCFHIDEVDVSPVVRKSGAEGPGDAGVGVQFRDVPVLLSEKVVDEEGLVGAGDVLSAVERRDRAEERGCDEVVALPPTIALAVGEQLCELMAGPAEEVTSDLGGVHPAIAAAALDGAHDPFGGRSVHRDLPV